MIVLLTGASGFIGRRLAHALRAAGHRVIEARRDASGDEEDAVQADFVRDLRVCDWLPRVVGVDVVINAVGILRERGEQTFERIHVLAPIALFGACAAAGVRKVVQISALGADTGTTGYFSSKHAADVTLTSLPVQWTIVQPAIVFGPEGTSARLFTMLASLPLVPLPGGGRQRVQPIHVDDLVASILSLLSREDFAQRRVQLAGPEPMTLRDFICRLRHTLQLQPCRFISIPMALVRAAARVMEISRNSLLDRETLSMLETGNTAEASAAPELLQRAPRPVEEFVPESLRASVVREARRAWLLPLLRFGIVAFVALVVVFYLMVAKPM